MSNAHPRQLHIPILLWWRLVRDLRFRGMGKRESGAFLLGRRGEHEDIVVKYICYDDLDPNALISGVVKLKSSAFSRLWDYCRASQLDVLADAHTHPDAHPQQSPSDRMNPMISEPGHLALILPSYAKTIGWQFKDVAIYEYLGDYQWLDVKQSNRKQRIRFSWW